MPLGPGARLDAYELIRPLGSGGMGEVWLARDTRLNREVAIKVLPADWVSDEHRRRRFIQEAQAASALNHPHIITIYEIEADQGIDFIAMEYVRGKSLDALIPRQGLRLEESLRIAIAVADALAAAHTRGIVHRDLKPANVMVGTDGVVKVVDFGLAKLLASDDDSNPETETRTVKADVSAPGTIAGTAAYMSPEQALGQKVDSRSDIFSFGAMLYEMTTGVRAFAGKSTADTLASVIAAQPKPPIAIAPQVSRDLEKIILRCLRREPTRRFQTMLDVQIELQELKEESDSGRPTVGPAPRPRGWWPVFAAAAIVALAAVGAWYVFFRLAAVQPNATVKTTSVRRNLTRLTFDPGLQTDATWSPDGRFIAYASDKAGNFDIWVQPVAGGDAVQITKSPAQETEPDWSPDGSTIVFRSERDGGGLFVVPSLGGIERRLTSFGVRPKWSPDGAHILFSSSPEALGVGRATYIVSLDGSQPRVVLERLARDFSRVFARAWHPDGRRVSILGRTEKQGLAVFTVPLSGGPPAVTTLTPFESELPEQPVQFQWTASGAALVLECNRAGISSLWRLTVDPQTLEAASLDRLTTGTVNDKRVALSRDGKYAAFTSQVESHRLWLFPIDAALGRFTGDARPVTAATTLVVSAALAPDGHRMAYPLLGVGGSVWELWVEDVLTNDRRQLARDRVVRTSLTWSPDGGRLAYQWVRLTGTSGEVTVAVRPAAGGDEQLLSDPLKMNVVPFGWSPDGQSLLVSSTSSTSTTSEGSAITLWPLAAAPHADRAKRALTSSADHGLWQESFSPNGRWIVFVAVDSRGLDATATLYVIPSAGAPPEQWSGLTDPEGWADKPRWSPDGKLLYFWLRQGSLYNVWALRFDDGQGTGVGAPFQITHFDGRSRQLNVEDLGSSDQSVSRTGLLLPITDVTGSIWMLDNVDK